VCEITIKTVPCGVRSHRWLLHGLLHRGRGRVLSRDILDILVHGDGSGGGGGHGVAVKGLQRKCARGTVHARGGGGRAKGAACEHSKRLTRPLARFSAFRGGWGWVKRAVGGAAAEGWRAENCASNFCGGVGGATERGVVTNARAPVKARTRCAVRVIVAYKPGFALRRVGQRAQGAWYGCGWTHRLKIWKLCFFLVRKLLKVEGNFLLPSEKSKQESKSKTKSSIAQTTGQTAQNRPKWGYPFCKLYCSR